MSTDQKPTKAELEAEIERLRHDVGATVEELTHRLDVKARVSARVRSVPPAVPLAVAAVCAVGIGLLIWRRRAD